ncbi:MAG: hypothetical protein LBR74_01390 [Eubacterium sp.]|jgi:hypothetical protein|nr:hypothetical protein [Eubacterium sp.]
MRYSLWLNGQKVFNAYEIKNNFDLQSLKSYYYGGSLLKWLRRHSGEKIADIIENSKSNNIEKTLCEAFGKNYIKNTDVKAKPGAVYFYSSGLPCSFYSSHLNSYLYFLKNFHIFDSFNLSYFWIDSFSFSSLIMGSFDIRQFKLSKFEYQEYKTFSEYINSYQLNKFGYGIQII